MLWIPGPNEVLIIVIVWLGLTFGSGLLGIVVLVRRWRAKRTERDEGDPGCHPDGE
jgi:hypothetical protein